MASQSPEFCEYRCRSKLQPRRRRSRSAANIDAGRRRYAASTDLTPATDYVDASLDWNLRRSSANNGQSSRSGSWLQRRLTGFGRSVPISDCQRTREATSTVMPPTKTMSASASERPHTVHSCSIAAASSSTGNVLHLTPAYDHKCVSCPELSDAPSSTSVPVDMQGGLAAKPPKHNAVRKTHSDAGFKATSSTTDSGMSTSVIQRHLLSVPAVFVTSYTRSVESRQAPDLRNQQQQPERRQSVSGARQRLVSMSDSRLGSCGHASNSPTTARIWKLNEYLCVGNSAAAANDRLLCRHSVFGLVDLSVGTAGVRDDVGAELWAPCTCDDGRRHRRSVLRLDVSRTDLDDVRSCFPTINRFVDGFRRRRSDAWSTLNTTTVASMPVGCVMIYCETGDTLSILAAAQYLVSADGLTVDQVELCLANAGCTTPLVQAFTAVLHSIYNQRELHRKQVLPRQSQQIEDTTAVEEESTPRWSASRRQRFSRQRSESTILDTKSMRPITIEAWPERN